MPLASRLASIVSPSGSVKDRGGLGLGAGQRLNQVQIPTPVGQRCPADFLPHQS
jgi:hypothetical protein